MSLRRFNESLQNGATIQAAAVESDLWIDKGSDPPDYTPVAQASEEAARIAAELGREQLAFAREQYEDSKPVLEDIAEAQQAAMGQQLTQAEDYYDYQTETFRPLERGLVADAESFNTDAYRERVARQAAADAGRAFGVTRAANERAMASMGVNPNSGKYQAIASQAGLGLAAQRAAAMTGARERATDVGWAKRLDAAGLGRNLPGASTAAYTSATGAGNSAGANLQQPGAAMQGAMQGAHSTMMDGQQMKVQGLSNVLNAQTQWAVADARNGSEFLGTALGAGVGFISDRRLKTDIVQVGYDASLGLNIYEFNYVGEPDKRYRGVMADEVEELYPTAVMHDEHGYASVDYAALGITMVEV